MTISLLVKPYETIKFPSFTTLIVPLTVFFIHLIELMELFRFSSSDNGFIVLMLEFFFMLQGRTSIYLLAFSLFSIVKIYVLFYLMGKEKVDYNKEIKDEQFKIMEERRKMIEEQLQKHRERQAVIIREK